MSKQIVSDISHCTFHIFHRVDKFAQFKSLRNAKYANDKVKVNELGFVLRLSLA